MNWPRIVSLVLALCLHGTAIYLMFARSSGGALAEGNGSDNLTVVATVSLESADLFTQSAQQASAETAASRGKTEIDAPVSMKSETPQQDTAPPLQETADSAPVLEKSVPAKVSPPEEQNTHSQMASVASAPQDEQQASAAEAARRSKSWSLYQTELYSAVERHKVHIAKTGEVLLQVTIAPSGQILDRVVTKSSGAPELDRAAIAALERASPFPPIPPDVSSGPLTLAVPFKFRIR